MSEDKPQETNLREEIKDKFLKEIRDETGTERWFNTVQLFRDFVSALEIEARTKESEARAAVMNVQLQREIAARHGRN